MIAYLSAPYSFYADKDALMHKVMTFSGQYMVDHPGSYLVSPLFNHFSLHVRGLGADYAFWQSCSRDLLRRCDMLLVYQLPGWDTSEGVTDERKIANLLGIKISYMAA